jgi:hypothetical protein
VSSQNSPDRLLPDRLVSERYNVTTRTLDRWDRRPEMGFPAALKINNRKYRSEAELSAWDAAMAAKSRVAGHTT